MTSGNDVCRMTALEIASNVRDKSISPTEVAEASIARMEALDPVLHAYCTPTPDLMRDAGQIGRGQDHARRGRRVRWPACRSESRISSS